MTEDVREAIALFPRWHYPFELYGQPTLIDPARANRHRQRRRYFFDPLVRLLGGSLAGRRVLDLGCNAGFWSLCAVEHGCDFVLGVDGRAVHVEQAELVFDAHQVPTQRYQFRCASVFDLAAEDLGTFDVVLCLGLLYHTSRPMELLEWAARVNSDVLLIDTALSGRDGSVLEIAFDNPDDPRSSCDGELVFYPSRQAVLDMVGHLGYRAVVLEPHFDDYAGAEDFRAGRRRAFLCAKRTSLDAWEAP